MFIIEDITYGHICIYGHDQPLACRVLTSLVQLPSTINLFLVQLTKADYMLEVRAHSHENNGHRDISGDCCDPACKLSQSFMHCMVQ